MLMLMVDHCHKPHSWSATAESVEQILLAPQFMLSSSVIGGPQPTLFGWLAWLFTCTRTVSTKSRLIVVLNSTHTTRPEGEALLFNSQEPLPQNKTTNDEPLIEMSCVMKVGSWQLLRKSNVTLDFKALQLSSIMEGKDPKVIPGPIASPSRPCLKKWRWRSQQKCFGDTGITQTSLEKAGNILYSIRTTRVKSLYMKTIYTNSKVTIHCSSFVQKISLIHQEVTRRPFPGTQTGNTREGQIHPGQHGCLQKPPDFSINGNKNRGVEQFAGLVRSQLGQHLWASRSPLGSGFLETQ